MGEGGGEKRNGRGCGLLGGWRKVGTIIEAKGRSEGRGYCRVLFDVLSVKRTANTKVTMVFKLFVCLFVCLFFVFILGHIDYICEVHSIFVSFLFGFCYLFGFSETL